MKFFYVGISGVDGIRLGCYKILVFFGISTMNFFLKFIYIVLSNVGCINSEMFHNCQNHVMISLEVEIVLTAHPTQINRRSLQYKHIRIVHLLEYNDRPDLGHKDGEMLIEDL
ncbi:phosphoenolpyruvate carboxylase-like isoform X2 [Chenopodium quinoa]|nr:phosphoenolpyruvate carboxylase-like isoform X2 [Chenopodium quinoa]